MADVKTVCETCLGKRYTEKVLEYKYKDKNMNDILKMTITESFDFFKDEEIKNKFKALIEVGLDYLELGQTHDTFSGGEAQRLKLASKLHKKGEFYILDEPTSGLHFYDIEKLIKLLNKLVDAGNSVLVIEHNLDVIKQADWIIDMGPGGGNEGGEIIAEGTPSEIKSDSESITGKFL